MAKFRSYILCTLVLASCFRVAAQQAVTLTVTSHPKETIAKKAFSSPYTVKAAYADGSPAAGYSLTVSHPGDRDEDGDIIYETTALQTDENGIAQFMPSVPERPYNALVTFSAPDDNEHAVTAPFLVHTRLAQAGGSLALVDFTPAGAPIRTRSDSSSSLLISLMQKGFVRVGNADFTDQVASKDKDAVYKAAKSLFGTACAYLIYGTVTYAAPIEKNDTGYACTLRADITCINMKDGAILYHTVTEASATEKQSGTALTTARTALAKDLAMQIYYGM